MPATRCTVHSLAVADLDQAAQDPALAALLAEGWTVLATVVVTDDPERGPVLQLLLAPPRDHTVPRVALLAAGIVILACMVQAGAAFLAWLP